MTEFLDRWDGDIVRALRYQDEQLCELAANKIEELRAALDILQAAMTAKKPIPLALKKAIIEARAALSASQPAQKAPAP